MRPFRLALAMLLLALCLPALAGAQTLTIWLDRPPVYQIRGMDTRDATVQIVWDEESNADERWLISSRVGVLYSDEGLGLPVFPFYVIYATPAQWRLGDQLVLCRRWLETPLLPERTSCDFQIPRPLYAVQLPQVHLGVAP